MFVKFVEGKLTFFKFIRMHLFFFFFGLDKLNQKLFKEKIAWYIMEHPVETAIVIEMMKSLFTSILE